MQRSITPYRKRSASKSIKRKYGRRRLFAPNEVSAIILPPSRVAGFPNKIRTKLKYAEYVALDPSSTALAGAAYRLNGMFDPTVAVGGHQPLGLDNFIAIYGRWEVIKAKIRVTFINGPDNHFLFGFVVADSVQTFGTVTNTIVELGKNCVYRYCHGYSTGMQTAPYVERTYDIAYELGKALGDDTLQGNTTNDPATQLHANVFMGTVDGGDTTAGGFHVVIEYDCVFDNPKPNQTAN